MPGARDPGLRLLAATPSLLGEPPSWQPREQLLHCCEIPGRQLLRFDPLTTAREHRPAAELAAQPLAGCVPALSVDVPGLPVNHAHH
jgi:sugar lactone lactonase YvrE